MEARKKTNAIKRLYKRIKKSTGLIKNKNSKYSAELSIFFNEHTTILDFYNMISKNGLYPDCDINQPILDRWTFLHLACYRGNIDIAKVLLKMGAYVNPIRYGMLTPLDDALENNHFELIKLLIEHGGITLLGIEFYLNKYDQVLSRFNESANILANTILSIRNYLLSISMINTSGQDLNKKNDLFLIALKNLNIDKARDLLDTKLINIRSFDTYYLGTSCTRMAVHDNNLDMVKLLVQYGGLIIEDNIPGILSIPKLARQLGYNDIAKFLEEEQRNRYHILRIEADPNNIKQKFPLFSLGLFSDNKSTLYNQLPNEIAEEIAIKMIGSYRN
jgi:hypothetical protein